MVRTKDDFWQYAEQHGSRFKCKFCNRDFSGGVSRLKFHLSGIKGQDVDICTQVTDEVQGKAYLHLMGKSKKLKSGTSESSNSTESQMGSSLFTSKSLHQSTMPQMIKKMDKSEVDKMLAKFFILNNISFNVVQTPAFIDFIKVVAEFGSTYNLPSYSTLRTKLIPEAKIPVDEYVANVKKSWIKTGCTIMSDTWTDIKHRVFINIIAYSPSGAVLMDSRDISSEKKTGLYLKEVISTVIDSIGAEHVVQFITDNASNFESAGDMLVGKYPSLYKTRCAAHGIQLLLKDIYSQVEWVKKIIDDAKEIQSYMYRHTIVTFLMREATKGKELRHACTTRFASNFQMLQSIIDVEDELRLLVASAEWRGLEYSKKSLGKHITEIIQNAEFWAQGKEVLQVLEPLVRVLRLVDGDGSTAGYLYGAMEMARETIKKMAVGNEAKYRLILILFERRRNDNIIHQVHTAAAFLNPAYMMSIEWRETREMKQGLTFVMENVVKSEERESFIGELQNYRLQLPTLFNTTAKTMMKTSHPRIWWDFCGDCIPIVQKYAVRILSQPCSASSCERNWSAWEAAQTKKRNRLSPKMLSKLVYVRMNTMMMEKFSLKESEDLKPIDLNNLNELDYCDEDAHHLIEDALDEHDSNNEDSNIVTIEPVADLDDNDLDDYFWSRGDYNL